jgi:hypothetical protein
LKVWRLIRLVAGGGMVMVLGAAALMLWPLLWPPDPDASVQLVNGRLVGETSGYVGRVDRESQTVDVSSSLVGWRPIILVVNHETAILVQDRQGGFGDLLKDLPVRVSYEVVGEKRLAKSIEVVTDDAGRARPAANGSVNSAAKPAATPPAATPPAATPPSPVGAITPPAVHPPVETTPPRATAPMPAPAVKLPEEVPQPRAAAPAPAAKPPADTVPRPGVSARSFGQGSCRGRAAACSRACDDETAGRSAAATRR